MNYDDLVLDPLAIAVSGLVAHLLAFVLLREARQEGWTDDEKRWIPRAAALVGAFVGFGLGAAQAGGTWQDVLAGALGGALAVWRREALPAGQ